MKSLAKFKTPIDSNLNNANTFLLNENDRFTKRLKLNIFAIGEEELGLARTSVRD